MKTANWLIATTVLFFATSCGNNSTKTETGSTDSTSTSNSAYSADSNSGVTTEGISQSVTVPEKIQSTFKLKYPNVTNVSWSHYQPTSTFEWDWSGWPV